jgi:hypothetical protein
MKRPNRGTRYRRTIRKLRGIINEMMPRLDEQYRARVLDQLSQSKPEEL